MPRSSGSGRPASSSCSAPHAPSTGGPVLSAAIDRYVEIAGIRGGDVVELRSDRFPGRVRVRLDIDDAAVACEPEWGRVPSPASSPSPPPRCGLRRIVTSTLPAGRRAVVVGGAGRRRRPGARCGARRRGRPGPDRRARRAGRRGRRRPVRPPPWPSPPGGGPRPADRQRRRRRAPVPLPDDVEIVVVHTGAGPGARGVHVRRARRRVRGRRGGHRSAARGVARRCRADHRSAGAPAGPPRRVREPAGAGRGRGAAAGDVVGLGRLLGESHASARDDFEVSTPTADNIVSRLARTPGVLGARLTGAGFGGCVVAVARPGTRLAPGSTPPCCSRGRCRRRR